MNERKREQIQFCLLKRLVEKISPDWKTLNILDGTFHIR